MLIFLIVFLYSDTYDNSRTQSHKNLFYVFNFSMSKADKWLNFELFFYRMQDDEPGRCSPYGLVEDSCITEEKGKMIKAGGEA